MVGPAAVDYAENGDEAVATYTTTGLTSESVVWALSGTDGAEFEIAGGVLEFVSVPDYEKPSDGGADNVYEVTVTASDASTARASIDVAVTVSDVNDPNIVVIMADDAGYEAFGAYGSTQYSTPRLDAIAASGARFDNSFSTPLCTPSRYAIMTGKSNVRNYNNWITMVRSTYTFGDLFSDAGYATAIAGKWQLNSNRRLVAPYVRTKDAGQGFDSHCLWFTNLTSSGIGSRYWNPTIECNGALIDTTASDYGPDIFVDFLLDFIETNQNRPFFAYYPMVLPHVPFELPPDSSCGPDDRSSCIYEKMVSRADHNVGLIYDKLDTLGLLDNTLLLFTADNGTPRSIVSQLGGETIYGGKAMTTDGGTRTPLIAHVPGQSQGRVITDLVDITDILPTVADAAGIDLPEDGTFAGTFDGVSFWDQLQGNAGTPREWIYRYYWPQPYKRHHDRPSQHPEIAYARDKQYKLYSTGELFDVTEDPLELWPLPSDDTDSAQARTTLQAVLDSMPGRGVNLMLIDGGFGEPPDAVRRPRSRPVLRAATVVYDELTLEYVGQVKDTPTPADSFTVQVDGAEVEVTAVSIAEPDLSTVTSGLTDVTLTLESGVVAGQEVTVSYVPGENSIRHDNRTGGNLAAPLSDREVVNSTPEPPSSPTSLAVSSRTYKLVTLVWDDPGDDSIESYQVLRRSRDRDSYGDNRGAAEFVVVGETDSPAVTYTDASVTPRTRYVYRVKARNVGGLSEVSGYANADTPQRPANSPATGAPTITGTARVGDTLTADTAGIADTNGLDNVSYSYQWLADDTDIAGATGSTYTPVRADLTKDIKVRVSFSDDAGNTETLTSAAVGPVDHQTSQQQQVALPRLTATVHDAPAGHDGSNVFTFELRFSEELRPDFGYARLRDHAFTITGGTVTNAGRIERPENGVNKNIRWRITIDPDTSGDVTITLPATEDCEADGAICTEDGRMFSGPLQLTVPRSGTGVTVVNLVAAGDPVIVGAARVGETLTADVSGIADPDGLDNVSFSYQWLTDDTDIAGATSSTYTPVAADLTKAIKVRVSFSDDAGNAETLTSAATAAVALPRLTATVHDAPDSHDGNTVFTFELRFSEELRPDFGYATLRDDAFTITGGTVTGASRIERPENGVNKNIRWRITIDPDTNGTVTITLPSTEDCEANGAICTQDHRMFSGPLELTVPRSQG